jgi:formylmethanofuran dehydrogenase subunit C
MSPLKLTLRTPPPCRIDGSALIPDRLAGKARDEILRIELQGWNQRFAVGDLFRISGDDPQRLVLDAMDGSVMRIGAGMHAGELTVGGDAGDYAGESMRGGTLHIRGNAGDYLGAGMRGGGIDVSGTAASFVGSARAGHTQGMAGGIITVRGDAGDRAGDRMRRGLLLISGNAGVYCAARMLGGTIAVLGETGAHAGYLMRRGTMVLNHPIEPLPTFNLNGERELLAMRLLLASIGKHNRAFRVLGSARFTRWLGDLGAEGKGELFVRSGGSGRE